MAELPFVAWRPWAGDSDGVVGAARTMARSQQEAPRTCPSIPFLSLHPFLLIQFQLSSISICFKVSIRPLCSHACTPWFPSNWVTDNFNSLGLTRGSFQSSPSLSLLLFPTQEPSSGSDSACASERTAGHTCRCMSPRSPDWGLVFLQNSRSFVLTHWARAHRRARQRARGGGNLDASHYHRGADAQSC